MLEALMRRGGSATTWELAQDMHAVAVHSEVHSLRCLLRSEHGFSREGALAAVRALDLGTNEHGRRVVRYMVSAEV